MSLSFKTSSVTVGDLLSASNIFRMPVFQRPYSWNEETALELFGDIIDAMERPGRGRFSYFLGPIILSRKSAKAPFEVVDGQQRLVTLTAILAVLRDLLPEGEVQQELQDTIKRPPKAVRGLEEAPRIKLRDIDQESLAAWVHEPGGTHHLPDDGPTEASDRLLAAILAIKSEIGIVDDRYIQRLANFILTKCLFLQIGATTLDDAYILFRSFNSRGLALNDLDIIRAELVGTTDDYEPQLAEQIAQCWDHIQSEIGHDEFFTYVKTIIFLVAPQSRETELRHSVRAILRVPSTAVKFKQCLTFFLAAYDGLDNANLDFGPSSATINRVIHCLKNLPFDDWRAPTLIWLARKPNASDTFKFVSALEALAIGIMILGKTKSQTAKRFHSVLTEVLDGVALGHTGKLQLTNMELSKIRDTLFAPVPVRKKFVRHLLLRLNVEALDKSITPYFPSDATVEHILPQRPRATSYWVRAFPDPKVRKYCCGLLGNYALLTASLNAKAKNDDFVAKRKAIFALSNVNMFPLTGNLVTFDTWTEADINRRHGDMLSLLGSMLGVPFHWPGLTLANVAAE